MRLEFFFSFRSISLTKDIVFTAILFHERVNIAKLAKNCRTFNRVELFNQQNGRHAYPVEKGKGVVCSSVNVRISEMSERNTCTRDLD